MWSVDCGSSKLGGQAVNTWRLSRRPVRRPLNRWHGLTRTALLFSVVLGQAGNAGPRRSFDEDVSEAGFRYTVMTPREGQKGQHLPGGLPWVVKMPPS